MIFGCSELGEKSEKPNDHSFSMEELSEKQVVIVGKTMSYPMTGNGKPIPPGLGHGESWGMVPLWHDVLPTFSCQPRIHKPWLIN